MDMRYSSLDMARGFAVITMLFVNTIAFLASSLPLFLKHNQPMMLPADLIAPLFQFIMGVSLVVSLNRRKAEGGLGWRHVLRRAAALVLLGFVLVGSLFGFKEIQWGILQSLGVGLVFGFLAMSLSIPLRVLATLVILALYTLAIQNLPDFAYYASIANHGGPLGAIAYGAVAIFGTIAGEWLYGDKTKTRRCIEAGLVLTLVSLLLSLAVPFNRLDSSASYMIFSAGFSFLVMSAFYIIGENRKTNVTLLSLMGRNSLSLWIAQYIVLYLPVLYFIGGCCFMSAYMAIAAAILYLPLFYVLADVLDWKGIRLPI